MAAIVVDPVRHFLQSRGFETAGPPLRLAGLGHEARALKDLEVLRDGRQLQMKGLGQLIDGRLSLGQPGENRPPSGVGKRGKSRVQLVDLSLFSYMAN